MEQKIVNELLKLGIRQWEVLENIRCKDGISLFRVASGNGHYVLKDIEKEEYRREIANYLLLESLGVKTIPLIGHTERSLLLEDINFSHKYRLGLKDDMQSEAVARCLAGWYKKLHAKGIGYVHDHGNGMYMEGDCFTPENISLVMETTRTKEKPVWESIIRHYQELKDMLDHTVKTLNYNDFYYTNLIVAKDESEAFMFDYNLLGKGYAASDLRNVTVQLEPSAKDAFLKAYGETSRKEMLMDEIIGNVVSLYFASIRDAFPDWGYELLDDLDIGTVKALHELFGED